MLCEARCLAHSQAGFYRSGSRIVGFMVSGSVVLGDGVGTAPEEVEGDRSCARARCRWDGGGEAVVTGRLWVVVEEDDEEVVVAD